MAQYKVETQSLDPKISSHYEVMYLANGATGEIVSTENPLPVTLGSENITVTGNITIPTSVEISNDVGNPIPISANSSPNSEDNPIHVQTYQAPGGTDYFGALLVNQLTPHVQINSYEGVETRDIQIYTGGGGDVIENDPDILVSCSANTGSYGVYRSRRFIPFRSGQSSVSRILCQFANNVSGISQRAGIANQESAYYVGYDGTNDRIRFLHTYGGRAEVRELEVTGTSSGSQTITLTLGGTIYTTNIATSDSASLVASKIATTINTSNTTNWLATSSSSIVQILSGSTGAIGGTYSITSTGNITGNITQKVAGVAATNEWTDFDTTPSWFDKTAYNHWQFQYSWVGVEVYALNAIKNKWTMVKRHGLQNDNTLPVRKPAFKPSIVCYNLGAASNASIHVASLFGAVEGVETITKYTHAGGVTKTSLASGTYHHIMSIQNPYLNPDYKLNFRQIRFFDLTIATQCNDPMEVYIMFNQPLASGGEYVWDKVGERLYQSSTTTGTMDMTLDTPVVSLIAGLTGSVAQFNLMDYHLILPPGTHMSLVAYSTAAIQKIAIAGTWGTIG